MHKSLAAFARIHWPLEYNDYLNDKVHGCHSGKRKRLKQIIKAEIMNGEKEYKFDDWSKEYGEYHEWQGGYFYAETY